MEKLKWIAVNGVEPDLPDGTMVKLLRYYADDEFRTTSYIPNTVMIVWDDVICYALEPKDPIIELVDAAQSVTDSYCDGDVHPNEYVRLFGATKAVIDTL
jgi:hypothetical protein